MEFENEDLVNLYPGKIYLVRNPLRTAISWKTRPESKVIFLLHESEFNNKILTDFLKKIASYLQMPEGFAGFGIIRSNPTDEDLSALPAAFGIVFDESLKREPQPFQAGEKRIFFSKKLKDLKDDIPEKKILQGYLNEIKNALSLS